MYVWRFVYFSFSFGSKIVVFHVSNIVESKSKHGLWNRSTEEIDHCCSSVGL